MSAPRVMFATPAYDGKLLNEYVNSLAQSRNLLAAEGIISCHAVQSNDLVERARNSLLADFMETDCTDLIYIDADQGWDPRAPLLATRLPQLFVCAVSPPRRDNPDKWPCRWKEPFNVEEGLIELGYCGFGWVRLKRLAVVQMYEAYPDAWIYDEFRENRRIPWLFHHSVTNHRYFSEDITFCNQWTATGGRIWAMPGVKVTHTGPKTWEGSLREFLS